MWVAGAFVFVEPTMDRKIKSKSVVSYVVSSTVYRPRSTVFPYPYAPLLCLPNNRCIRSSAPSQMCSGIL